MPPARLHVVLRPASGPADPRYVLVHGAMDRAGSMLRLTRQLTGAEVVAYDRRGYAGSGHLPVAADAERQVDDLLTVLGDRPAIALGHSFGGVLVLAAAERRPDLIPAAVVWEPPQPWRTDRPPTTAGADALAQPDPAEAAEAFMRRAVGTPVWERLPPSTRLRRREEGPALLADLGSLHAGPPWDPERVTVPVVVGCGGSSPAYQHRAAADLAASLPRGALRTVAGAHHGAHLTHARELAGLLAEAAGLVTAAPSAAASRP